MAKLIFRHAQGERGATIVLIALLLPLLIGLLGLAVDFGMLFMHHSRLQHAADAMALAGVRVNSSAKAASLISLSDVEENEGSILFFKREDKSYTLVNQVVKSAEDRMAEKLEAADTSEVDAENAEFDSWLYASNGVRAYKVALEETFDTAFLKVFGIDDYPVKVTALAVAVPGATEEEVEKEVIGIFKISPNFYWETITEDNSNRAAFGTNKVQITVDGTPKDDSNSKLKIWLETVGWEAYKINNLQYYTDKADRYSEYTEFEPLTETMDKNGDVSQWVASYKDRESISDQNPTIRDPYCAEEIPAELQGNVTREKLWESFASLYNIVWTFDNQTFTKMLEMSGDSTGKMQAFFVDRPNKEAGKMGTYNGKTVNGWAVRGTVLNITSEDFGDKVASPLYVRIESEPAIMSNATGKTVTVVQPITINARGKNATPLLISYEGPSSSRRPDRDVPYIKVTDPTGLYALSETKNWNQANWDVNKLTSVTTSPPITLNLDSDFRGVIYAPFSKVIINGTGRIDGFVLAKEVVMEGSHTEQIMRLQTPVLVPIESDKASYHHAWSYEVKFPQDDYHIVYDTFTTYHSSAS